MNCGHPADVVCLGCDDTIPVSRMTERQKRIAWLDAQTFALRGCEERREERDALHAEWQRLSIEEAADREEREERRREIAEELRGERFDAIAGRSW